MAGREGEEKREVEGGRKLVAVLGSSGFYQGWGGPAVAGIVIVGDARLASELI